MQTGAGGDRHRRRRRTPGVAGTDTGCSGDRHRVQRRQTPGAAETDTGCGGDRHRVRRRQTQGAADGHRVWWRRTPGVVETDTGCGGDGHRVRQRRTPGAAETDTGCYYFASKLPEDDATLTPFYGRFEIFVRTRRIKLMSRKEGTESFVLIAISVWQISRKKREGLYIMHTHSLQWGAG